MLSFWTQGEGVRVCVDAVEDPLLSRWGYMPLSSFPSQLSLFLHASPGGCVWRPVIHRLPIPPLPAGNGMLIKLGATRTRPGHSSDWMLGNVMDSKGGGRRRRRTWRKWKEETGRERGASRIPGQNTVNQNGNKWYKKEPGISKKKLSYCLRNMN